MVWQRFYHRLFVEAMTGMYEHLLKMKETNPNSFSKSTQAKFFASVINTIDHIAEDPTKREFLLGNSLGETHRDWRRAKNGLPQRYRLFFKYFLAEQEIYYAWINNVYCLRKKGAKTDVYFVFKNILEREGIPSCRNELSKSSSDSMTK